jgi:hypothetical protein
LRLLPWFQEALRTEPDQHRDIADCSKCMETTDVHSRRALGCGWEPALDGAEPATLKSNVEVTVCPGYSCKLPEVVEVASAYAHWEKGTLSARLDGAEPTPQLLDGLVVLQGAIAELNEHRMKASTQKGGA